MEEANRHVRTYLDYYLGLKEAGYSVLINAKWGAGKTFFIRQYLAKRFGSLDDDYVYLSLNGLSSIQDVYDTLVAYFLPAVNKKGLRITGGLVSSFLKYSSVNTDLSLRDFVSPIRKNKLYIVDDLERYQGEIKEVFGFLSSLLEQDGVKVVVLANQDELLRDELSYASIKEKIIGKTLALNPDFDNAAKFFISELGDSAGAFTLRDKLFLVKNSYNKSSLGNLRILRQAMHEIVGFLDLFESDVYDKNEALDAFISMFFCIYIEFYSGNLSEKDILERKGFVAYIYGSRDKEYSKSRFDYIVEKYSGIDLRSDVFTNKAWHYFIVHGLADKEVVKGYIQESPYFTEQSGEPEWKVIWHWYDRSEKAFFGAISVLNRKFENREYQKVEEMLHVFDVKLWLSKTVFSEQNCEEVYHHCVLYIEDFFESLDVDDYFLDSDLRALYGLDTLLDTRFITYDVGYLELANEFFISLSKVLLDNLQKAIDKALDGRGKVLLSLLKNNIWEFQDKVCSVAVSATPYAQIPILKHISPIDFADQLASLEPGDMRLGFLAISTRLYGVNSGVKLDELEWLVEVKKRLIEVIPNYSVFKGEVLRAKVRDHIDRVLDKNKDK